MLGEMSMCAKLIEVSGALRLVLDAQSACKASNTHGVHDQKARGKPFLRRGRASCEAHAAW